VIINYLLATGNRVATIVDLNIGNIDFDECMINMNRQKNKNPIRIPMNKKLAPALSEYIYAYRSEVNGIPVSPSEPLFCSRHGERLTEDGLKKAIAEYNKARGVFKTSIHLFRHTFAKNWIIGGGDILTLQKMLGQKSLKVIQEYANLYASDIKESVDTYSTLSQRKRNTGKTLQRRK
jgi:integrase/recombinase XerD